MINFTPMTAEEMMYQISNTTQYISPDCVQWCKTALPEKCYSYSPILDIGLLIILIGFTFRDNNIIFYSLIVIGIIITIIGSYI